ncbi:MAG: hypothetical protein Q7T88_07280 [Methylotenera sp.]|nr:hypothetical protein [Methylotenera sp.]
MSSIDFKHLINEFPNDADAIVRLNSFLSKKTEDKNSNSFSFGISRIYEVTQPSSKSILVRILTRLVEIGILKEVFKVNSEDGSGIEDFTEFKNIPPVIYDNIRGKEVEVSLDNITLYYKISK